MGPMDWVRRKVQFLHTRPEGRVTSAQENRGSSSLRSFTPSTSSTPSFISKRVCQLCSLSGDISMRQTPEWSVVSFQWTLIVSPLLYFLEGSPLTLAGASPRHPPQGRISFMRTFSTRGSGDLNAAGLGSSVAGDWSKVACPQTNVDKERSRTPSSFPNGLNMISPPYC